jgi:DNA-binding transcriptional MerR regulator
MHPGSRPSLQSPPGGVVLHEADLADLDQRYADGISSAEILTVFQERGVRLSEGTFRKYVQLGLLPRSRRVGKKGKHKGSRGVYPVSVLRQIVAIKQMMADGLTIEQIQRSWIRFRPRIEAIESDLGELLEEMRKELAEPHFDTGRRQRLEEELQEAREEALELVQRLHHLEQEVAWSPDRAAPEADLELEEDIQPAGRFY